MEDNEMFALGEPFFTAQFGKDLAKTVLISAATTAGVCAGMIAVGAGVSWWKKRNEKNTEDPNETPVN